MHKLDRALVILFSVLLLGTISVFAGNVLVNEDGLQASYSSSDGSEGATFNLSVVGADGKNYTLIYKNGLVVSQPIYENDSNGIQENISMTVSDSGLMDGLVVYYEMEDTSSQITDSLGNNNLTSVSGAPNWGENGIVGNGIAMDTNTAYVYGSVGGDLDFGTTGDFTINFWVEDTNGTSDLTYFRSSSTHPMYSCVWTSYVPYNNMYCRIETSGAGNGVGIPQTNGTYIYQGLGEYHMITFTRFDTTKYRLFVDGELVGTESDNIWSNGLTHDANADVFYVGDLSGDRNAQAAVDELGIWNRSLNSTEISELYNNGEGLAYE